MSGVQNLVRKGDGVAELLLLQSGAEHGRADLLLLLLWYSSAVVHSPVSEVHSL